MPDRPMSARDKVDEGYGVPDALREFAGGGRRGTALAATRFVPPVGAGLSVPGMFLGSGWALACVLGGLAATVLTGVVDARMKSGQ